LQGRENDTRLEQKQQLSLDYPIRWQVGKRNCGKGKFTGGNNNNTIVLTPRDNSTTRQYLVGENTLTQLDNNGNRISGKLADRYILRRTDVTKSSSSHPSH
jgi:Uncharacterized lipoprotein NlpE involved in copper resistance.